MVLDRLFPDQFAAARIDRVNAGVEVTEVKPVDCAVRIGADCRRTAHFAFGVKGPPDTPALRIERVNAAVLATGKNRFVCHSGLRTCARCIGKTECPFKFKLNDILRSDAPNRRRLITAVVDTIAPTIPQRLAI